MATFMFLVLVVIGGLIAGFVCTKEGRFNFNFIVTTIAYVLGVTLLAAFLTTMGLL